MAGTDRHPSLGTRLLGERVSLRAPRLTDAEPLAALLTANRSYLEPFSPAASLYMNHPRSVQASISEQRKQWRQDRGYTFVVFARSAGQPLVGRLVLNQIVRGAFCNAYVGYWISESHRGRGLAHEALELAVEFAFGPAQLHRLQAAVQPENRASRRVVEKAGFRVEGLARRYLHIAGAWRDHLLYARTVEEHRAQPAADGPA